MDRKPVQTFQNNQAIAVHALHIHVHALQSQIYLNSVILYSMILVPGAYDPSGLRQESRALRATILK